MRVPWRTKPKDDSFKQAEKALHEAEEKLLEVEQRGEEVSEVAAALRHMREKNHFAEQLEHIIRRGG